MLRKAGLEALLPQRAVDHHLVVAERGVNGYAIVPEQLKVNVHRFPLGIVVTQGNHIAQNKQGRRLPGINVVEDELGSRFVVVIRAEELFEEQAALGVAGKIDDRRLCLARCPQHDALKGDP